MTADDVTPHLPLSPKDFLILFALAEGERHGYGLVKDMEALSDGEVLMDPANLYRTLRKLDRDGLVEESVAPTEDDRRRYYRLTKLGRRAVVAEAKRLDRLTQAARARELIPGSEAAG